MFCVKKQMYKGLLLGSVSLLPVNVFAQESSANSLCPIREFQSKLGAVTVWQKQFEDGVFDLVMAPVRKDESPPVIRLSFGGSKENRCHFPEVSVLKGGDWGWHVAWVSTAKQALYYARVDGEAWVSSLPKKVAAQLAEGVLLSEASDKLSLSYHLLNQATLQVLISEDEGRNFTISDEN